jgi:hypothetical protein
MKDLMASVVKSFENSAKRSGLLPLIVGADLKNRFNALRDFYRLALPEIKEAGKAEWGIDPYEINWVALFTPIESWLWNDIRALDLVLYPQYPIAGFFVDFANPVAMVAIECDGVAFHCDKAKDEARDTKLQNIGWTVYRISGKDCRDGVDSDDEWNSKARKFVKQIADRHNISRRHGNAQ